MDPIVLTKPKLNKQFYLTQIQAYYKLLKKYKLINELYPTRQYNDESPMFRFASEGKFQAKYSDGNKYVVAAHGHSFTSKYAALFKCLVETLERTSNISFKKESIFYASFNNLNQKAIDPIVFTGQSSVREKRIGWTAGLDLLKNQSCLLPAQLLYLNYQMDKDALRLTETNSNGSAGGIEHESTLLRAIYENVERDAYMTTYFLRVQMPLIDLIFLKSQFTGEGQKALSIILDQVERYKYELRVFDMTNDLKIPAFTAVLIDKTGVGPAMTWGCKSSFDGEYAIISCIEEAFQGRSWLRSIVNTKLKDFINIDPKKIQTLSERGMFWYSTETLKYFDYLFGQQPKKLIVPKSNLSRREELAKVLAALKKANIDVYYKDITLDLFRPLGFLAYKVLTPQLQFLILNENIRSINKERLKQVAQFFAVKNEIINTLPQPFL